MEQAKKLSLNKVSIQRLQRNDNLTPYIQEIEQALNILKKSFNQQLLSLIVQKLAELVVKFQGKYDRNHDTSLKNLLFIIFTIPQKRTSDLAYIKRQLAKYYVKESSNFLHFQEHIESKKLSIKINQYQFKHLICELITQTYRSIEQILLRQFQDIHRLSEKQCKLLHFYFLAIKQNFSSASVGIFLKSLENLYTLDKYQALGMLDYYQLYQEIFLKVFKKAPNQILGSIQESSINSCKDFFVLDQKKFSDKSYEMRRYKTAAKHHLSTELKPHIWTAQRQLQLIALYLEHKKVSTAREIMNLKYQDQPQFQQLVKVKRKFNKILRHSIRILQRFYESHCQDQEAVIPKMIEVDEDKVKLLIGAPYKIKAYLCEIYRQHSMSYQSICETIIEINAFIKQKTRYIDYFNQNRPEKIQLHF